MHVAADHDRVGRLALAEIVEQTASSRRVAVPAVGPELLARPRLSVELGHQGLLPDHVPSGLGPIEPGGEPLLLRIPEHREARVESGLALLDDVGPAATRLGARLVRAILA